MAESQFVIADAGPVIALSRVDCLYLLERLFGKVLLTEEIRREALPAADYPGRASIAAAVDEGWLEVISPAPSDWQPVNPGIDPGERSTIGAALGMNGALLIIDDRAGRAEARFHGIRIIGTAAVIGLARLRGLIPAARPLLEALVSAGYYLHPSVIETVVGDLGE